MSRSFAFPRAIAPLFIPPFVPTNREAVTASRPAATASRPAREQPGTAAPFTRCRAVDRAAFGRPILGVLMLTLAQGVCHAQTPAAVAASVEDVRASPAVREAGATAITAGVNINTADAPQLARGLRGVGSSKAEAIVRYREQFGPFESIDELAEVSGIGPATVARNRDLIRLQ